jgi:hypothetical protein
VIPDALATDPGRLVESSLERAAPRQFEQTFDDKRLVLFASGGRDLTHVPRENLAPQYSPAGTTGGPAGFLGFDLPVREARAGDTLRLVTYWNMPQAREVAVGFGNVTDKVAHVAAGERVRVETDFVIPPDAAGDTHIHLGDWDLAHVGVEPRVAAVQASAITHPRDEAFAESGAMAATIHLIGYDLPSAEFLAGDPVPITLYWRADQPVGKNYMVFVHLLGDQFNPAHSPSNPLWGQIDRVPQAGEYPTTAWRPGQIVSDAYRVAIEQNAPPGRYQIEIGMYDPASGTRLAVNDGQDHVVVAEIEIR